MSFKSINDILCLLQLETKLQEQPFQRLLKCWSEVVGTTVAAHARPLSLQRDVLRVATSSAAWAQNLTFERQRLLVKLNAVLPTPLVDIRFSTAGWHSVKQVDQPPKLSAPLQHPSYLGKEFSIENDVKSTASDANAAFADWTVAIQRRLQGLALCPNCEYPTPPGELQRWGVCCLCAAKKFSQKE
ncbi:RNA-binding protein [Fischerella major NIES-592]|uniref:RNA-binding protein n=1 Tax=Fischerella major NIES-592 TaxID=210994 RepID=A0A1U7GUD8_9CYAN|nr:DciA family protein [Fischerella major]OKH11665.1 RNA-binding protein [Fischerella major NIES-592]